MSGKARTLPFDPGPTNARIGPDSPPPGRSTNAEDVDERTAEASDLCDKNPNVAKTTERNFKLAT
jgi:hypothetical protein